MQENIATQTEFSTKLSSLNKQKRAFQLHIGQSIDPTRWGENHDFEHLHPTRFQFWSINKKD